MRPMLVGLALALAINAAPALAKSGFTSCFILLRPTAAKNVAYLTGSFPSPAYEVSDQQKYLDLFVKFLATKYPPPGSGTVQASCNFSTSASDAQQMSEDVLGPTGLNANSIVQTGWQP